MSGGNVGDVNAGGGNTTTETGGADGAASTEAFNKALARMTAAAEKRLEQDATRTERQEELGAAKQAAARTSV